MDQRDQDRDQQKLPSAYLYFNISHEERESAIYFLLESILKVRDQEPSLARASRFDEDVNIYLAHLLFAMSLPEYHEMASPFLSEQPEEVFQWVRETRDPLLRYFIFKVNADQMLVHSTIYNPDPEHKKESLPSKKTADERIVAAVMYYRHASKCHQAVYDRKTGVGEVLGKISENIDLYRRILLGVKEDYFRFIDCFRDQAFQRFTQQLSSYEREHRREMKLDQFLESYQRWLATHDGSSRNRVLQLAQELKTLDPRFHFDLSKLN